MKQISNIVFFAIALLVLTTGCDKTERYEIKKLESFAHFNNKKAGNYDVLTATSVYKVYIGVTAVADVDRTVSFTVTSPTGAVLGTQYTLDKTVATIKAGQAIDSITVKGDLAAYLGGRKDSLIFSITDPVVKATVYNPTFKLFMRGPCFEGDVDLNALKGLYANTRELLGTSPYGPYKTTISAVTLTSPTTGTITVTNIWDNGWGPITFELDWTDPKKRTATVVEQTAIAGSDAGDLNGAYAGETIAVRPFAGQSGTFSACTSTFSLKMQLGVTGIGFFNVLYTVNMAR